MNTLRQMLAVIAGAIVLGLVITLALVGNKIAQTWTEQNTNQLLGGALTLCGSAVALFALIAGGGLTYTLTRRAPTPPVAPLVTIDGRAIEASQLAAPQTGVPTWPTGGGDYRLLPQDSQTRRFSYKASPLDREEIS